MRYPFDRQSCILLVFALSSTTFALKSDSSAPEKASKFDTVTIPRVTSVTTLTTDGYTFTIHPSTVTGSRKPTTIVENGKTIVSSASLLIIPAPESSNSIPSSSSKISKSSSKDHKTSSTASKIPSSSSILSKSSSIPSRSSKTIKETGTTTHTHSSTTGSGSGKASSTNTRSSNSSKVTGSPSRASGLTVNGSVSSNSTRTKAGTSNSGITGTSSTKFNGDHSRNPSSTIIRTSMSKSNGINTRTSSSNITKSSSFYSNQTHSRTSSSSITKSTSSHSNQTQSIIPSSTRSTRISSSLHRSSSALFHNNHTSSGHSVSPNTTTSRTHSTRFISTKSVSKSSSSSSKESSSSKASGTRSTSKGATPSRSSTLPISTSSKGRSSSTSSTSSTAMVNQQPVISTLTSVVSGTTKLIPVIIGGAFTTPVPIATTAPPTSLVATGTVAKSSASALSSKLNVNIIPLINAWTNNPTKDTSNNAINAIKGILPEAENLLNSLGGDQKSTPCSGSTKRGLLLVARGLPNPFQIASDIVHSVACIDNTLNKISGDIESGVNAVKGVLSNVDDLTSLTQNLDQEENENQSQSDKSQSKTKTTESKSSKSQPSSSKSSSTSKSSSSSRSSCTQASVTRDIYVKCFPTTLSGKTTQVTQTCTTITSRVSGCSVTAFSTTTTSSGSAVMATNYDIITPDTGVIATAADVAHFSSRLAAIEASGVNGKLTGSGTITANPTSSKSPSSKSPSSKSPTSKPASSSKITSSSSKQTASPASTSRAKTISKTSSQPSTTKHSSTAAPLPPAYTTGTCSLHIYEGAYGGEVGGSISVTAEIKDGGGNKLADTDTSVKWGDSVTLSKSDSKLPYDVVISFPSTTSQKRSLGSNKSGNSKPKKRFLRGDESAKFKRICCGGMPPTLNYAWEHRIVTIQAGDMKVDTTDTDQSKMPYMNVGAYDNDGSPPNRQMDAYWNC